MSDTTRCGFLTQYKIPRNQWHTLRDMYKIFWPRHILSYNTIKTLIEWVTNNPSLDITIYSSDKNWEQHGTYVIVEQNGIRCNVLFNTLDVQRDQNLLLEAFHCIPSDQAFTLAAFVAHVQPVVETYLQNENLSRPHFCDSLLFYLPMKQSLQLPMEDKLGYHFKNLSANDVPLINRLWPHPVSSRQFIENLIRYNLTLGAYEGKTGNLCGWVMQEQIGTIGLLHVEDSYKRVGIAEQLVIHMAMLLANTGMDATATVLATNRPSRHLYHKLGFKIIDRVAWYDMAPIKYVITDGKVITQTAGLIDNEQSC